MPLRRLDLNDAGPQLVFDQDFADMIGRQWPDRAPAFDEDPGEWQINCQVFDIFVSEILQFLPSRMQ
jgi:hypothetical protein